MSQFQLLKTRRFFPIFWTQFFGAFNDNFLKNAMVILITFKSLHLFGVPPGQMVALAGAIFIFPFFLFSATAGQLADKYEKARIVHWIKIAEIAIMGLAAYAFLVEHFAILFVTLFLMGLHSTFFGPIKYSILPQHLEEQELVGGNAMVEAGTFLAILLGTITGGVLVSLQGLGPRLVSFGLVVTAIMGWLASLCIPKAEAVAPKLRIHWNPLPPTREILRYTRTNRYVYLGIIGVSWFWAFGSAMLSLLPSYCKEVLHANEGVVTFSLAIFSIGIGVGSLSCERLSRKRLELGLVPLGSIGITLFAADLFLIGTPAMSAARGGVLLDTLQLLSEPGGLRIVADLLLLSAFSGFLIVPLYTLLQEKSDFSYRSRVIAANNIINALFMVLSSVLLMGLMRAGISIPAIFLVLAALNVGVAVYIFSALPDFLSRFRLWLVANVRYRLQVVGEDRLPKEGGAILLCNHACYSDRTIIAAGVHRSIKFADGDACRQQLQAGELVCVFIKNKPEEELKQTFGSVSVPVIPVVLVKSPTGFRSRIELRIG